MIYSKQHIFSVIAFSALTLLACLISKPANAHKLNAAETNINYNERTKSLEIVHRFYLHDVNHLVQKHYKNSKLAPTEQQKYQVFTDYILENTSLKILNSKSNPLETNYVGSELETKHYYIYQEVKLISSSDIAKISVNIQSMQNQWKPKYWLYNIKFLNSKQKSFVLDMTVEVNYFNY